MKPFLPVAASALWLLVAAPLGAETRAEDPAEALVRHIAKDLRCAVCQNQSVYESNSELAQDMLRLIRDKVRAGQSEAAIRDYFFQRYGDYIYLEPTARGMNWLLWGGPFVGLLVGGYALVAAMRRWRKGEERGENSAPAAPGGDAGAEAAMKERIRRELDQVRM